MDWLWKARRAKRRAEQLDREVRKRVQAIDGEPPVMPSDAYLYDPVAMQMYFGGDVPDYLHPGTFGLPYEVLDGMARVSVVAPILKRRIDQVADHCTPQASRYSVGMHVRMRDPKQKMTAAAERSAREIERMILRAGGKHGHGSFEHFTRAVLRDSLVYDQLTFEVIRERGGRPYGMRGVDAKTVRLAKPNLTAMSRGQYDPKDVKYVQFMPRQQRIVAEFEDGEMAWGIRHPRTDFDVFGYGNPELGQMSRVIASLINAETYNDANFTNGIHVTTILALKAAMEPQTFHAVRRYLRALMTGPRNAKKTPLIKLDPGKDEELKAIRLGMSSKDMEFASHINFKIKLICAMYGIDPAEIGFVFGTEGVTSALSQAGPRDRLAHSKESGLRPLVRFYQRLLNQMLVWSWGPWEDFMVELAGMDAISEKERMDLAVQAVTHWATVDEVRTELDMKERGDEIGGLILNPQAVQVAQQLMQEEKEEAAGVEEGGFPGIEGPLPVDQGSESPFQVPAGSDLEEAGDYAEKALARTLARAISSGRVLTKAGSGKLPEAGTKWALVDEEPGVRAWIVEVAA